MFRLTCLWHLNTYSFVFSYFLFYLSHNYFDDVVLLEKVCFFSSSPLFYKFRNPRVLVSDIIWFTNSPEWCNVLKVNVPTIYFINFVLELLLSLEVYMLLLFSSTWSSMVFFYYFALWSLLDLDVVTLKVCDGGDEIYLLFFLSLPSFRRCLLSSRTKAQIVVCLPKYPFYNV